MHRNAVRRGQIKAHAGRSEYIYIYIYIYNAITQQTGQQHWAAPQGSTNITIGQQHWPAPLVTTGRHHWPGAPATCSKHVDDDDADDDHEDVNDGDGMVMMN
jgi:hypothetical protein